MHFNRQHFIMYFIDVRVAVSWLYGYLLCMLVFYCCIETGCFVRCYWSLEGLCNSGSGIAQWLERRTRDWKVAGSNHCRSGGRVFLSRVNFLCWLLFRYPFRPRVTAVARKRSRSFCQKCRCHVTAKHEYTLPMWLWMKWHCNLVHGWMVYTELAPKRQHFMWHQPGNNHRALSVHHFRGY